MGQQKLVRSRILNPQGVDAFDYYEDGALLINEAGYIEAVGKFSDLNPGTDVRIISRPKALLIPGLVDTHTHLPQFPICGKTAGNLLQWLKRYAFPVEEKFSEVDYARTLSKVFFETLAASGTTTALVMSSVHEASTHAAFEAARESGLRVAMGKVMMDQNVPDAMLESLEESLAASRRLAEKWHGQNNDLLRYAFSPRYAYSCSQELLQGASELLGQFSNSYLHTHLSENTGEIQQVEALYGNRLSYTQVYDQAGCLTDRTILAHGIYLSRDEMALLKERNARVAHCPTSNFFLKSGSFNLAAFRERQIPFGLGTDMGAGPDSCLLPVMRAMDEIQLSRQNSVPPAEALYRATLGGAEVLSLQAETGNLNVGKSADYTLLDLDAIMPWTEATFDSAEELLSQVMYLGGAQHVLSTVVRGKLVYQRRASRK